MNLTMLTLKRSWLLSSNDQEHTKETEACQGK